VIELVRGGWLTLAFMMLLSRAIFQVAGPVRMRAFLDGWQSGGVKRVWGVATLVFAAVLVAGTLSRGGLSGLDTALLVVLLLVLVADGAVNVLPAGFETFKDRMQRAWVRRTGKEGDRELFGTVNLLLALASGAAVAFVLLYRPVEWATVAGAAVAAAVVMPALMVTSNRRSAARSHSRP
jgi:hypothetical protein